MASFKGLDKMIYLLTLLLTACSSIPLAPNQATPTHQGLWVDGLADESGLHWYCKRGNQVLRECNDSAKACQEYCEGLE